MQLTSWKSYGKTAVAAAVACAILALAGSFLIPERYESKAVMRISPQSPPADSTPGVVDEDMMQRLEADGGECSRNACAGKPDPGG
jgi:uncharacterized protein involved in exopolysaccharide biosynthesis